MKLILVPEFGQPAFVSGLSNLISFKRRFGWFLSQYPRYQHAGDIFIPADSGRLGLWIHTPRKMCGFCDCGHDCGQMVIFLSIIVTAIVSLGEVSIVCDRLM